MRMINLGNLCTRACQPAKTSAGFLNSLCVFQSGTGIISVQVYKYTPPPLYPYTQVHKYRTMISSLLPPCRSAVDVYAPAVFQLLGKYFQPDTVCNAVGICPGTGAEANRNIFMKVIEKRHIYGTGMFFYDGNQSAAWKSFRYILRYVRSTLTQWVQILYPYHIPVVRF